MNKTLKVNFCRGFLKGTKGLIGYKTPRTILIKTRFGIHTFGVKFPIDVLILNKKNQVTKLKKNLKPRRIFVWNPKYNKVIELPNNNINKNNIRVGDTVKII